MGKTYFVSRHEGAVLWAKEKQLNIDFFLDHLNPDIIQEGDTVIGSLPMALAAEICRKKAHFFALSIKTTKEQRGKELSASELNKCECMIEEFKVERV